MPGIFPDLAAYRLSNTSVEYVHRFTGPRAGPHVMVSGIVHGNEPCGAVAVESLLLRAREHGIACGTLTLAFCNPQAYSTFNPERPLSGRYIDQDMNRLWNEDTIRNGQDSLELQRVRELVPILETVDYLLDLHSTAKTEQAMTLAGPLPRSRALADAIGFPELIIHDDGQHISGTRLRDFRQFSDPCGSSTALLIECGKHVATHTAKFATSAALRFLEHTGVITLTALERDLVAHFRCPQRHVAVTGSYHITSPHFRWSDDIVSMSTIDAAGTIIGWDGDRPVCTPHNQCMLIMPTIAPKPGMAAVRFGRVSC